MSTHPSPDLGPGVDRAVAMVADASRDLIVIVAADGTLRFMNRAARAALGLRDAPIETAGNLAGYVREEDVTQVSELIADVATRGTPRDGDARFVHRQSRLEMALSCRFVPASASNPSARSSVAMVARPHASPGRDATDLAAATDTAGLTRLAEMFAGIVGHDLRNPLNAILTSAHVAMRPPDDGTRTVALNRIVSSGHRMQRMIDQLLDVTRIRLGSGIPLHVSHADMHAIAQRVVQETAAANPDWTIDLQRLGDTTGAWDPDRAMQMLSNLVGNAVRHGDRAGGVQVVVDGSLTDAVTVTVHNDGAIPTDVMTVLFSPFRVVHQRRTKSVGLGLGLFVTRQIALAHGGEVTVTSSAENGTTFCVRLPRTAGHGPPAHVLSGLGEEDMAVLDMLATAPAATSITAQLFGAVALHERVPQEYWALFERYTRVLDLALERQTYRAESPQVSDELRAIAEQLGRLGAGAREVAELHARALKQRTRGATVAKAQALTSEGRLVSFELMGHLLSFYRRSSGFMGGNA